MLQRKPEMNKVIISTVSKEEINISILENKVTTA